MAGPGQPVISIVDADPDLADLPHEGGVAEAINEPAFQAAVGQLCDEVNAADRARARYVRGLSARLRRAHALPEQRLLLLDTVRRTTSRADHALAGFLSLEPPKPLSGLHLHKRTSATWERNVERLRAYGERLDGASTRGEVEHAIERYARQRTAIQPDGVRITANGATPADAGAGSSGAGGTTGMAPRAQSRDAGPLQSDAPPSPSSDAGPTLRGGPDD